MITFLIIIVLIIISTNLIHLNRKVNKMANVLEIVQNFIAQINLDLDNIQADVVKLQGLVAQGGNPAEIQALLQSILDRTNAIKNIEPE